MRCAANLKIESVAAEERQECFARGPDAREVEVAAIDPPCILNVPRVASLAGDDEDG